MIIVISAPSGTGKTTVVNKLLKRNHGKLMRSISVTTRKKRANEIDGYDYYFISRKEFLKMKKNGKFAEWAKVHGELYGTPKYFLENSIRNNRDLVLTIDVQGGVKVKKEYPDTIMIFLVPPSKNELKQRLKNRGLDSDEAIEKRLKAAQKEFSYQKHYHYVINNLSLEKTVNTINAIIIAEHAKISKFKHSTN